MAAGQCAGNGALEGRRKTAKATANKAKPMQIMISCTTFLPTMLCVLISKLTCCHHPGRSVPNCHPYYLKRSFAALIFYHQPLHFSYI
jgi:hypothetical protein